MEKLETFGIFGDLFWYFRSFGIIYVWIITQTFEEIEIWCNGGIQNILKVKGIGDWFKGLFGLDSGE